MSPRKYEMSKRAEAVERTRRRIVEATLAAHAEQGIGATSWEDIAARAGVGVGTVYRHFPSLDELIPACGVLTWDQLALPAPEQAAQVFRGTSSSAAERTRRLAETVFGVYERGAPAIENMRRERDLSPVLEQARLEVEAALDALVAEALRPLRPGARKRNVARALVDLDAWRALRQRFDAREATAAASELLLAAVRGARA